MTYHEPRKPGTLPPAKQAALQTARRQEWLTLVLRLTVLAALYATLGSTQALNAIWLKSIWALLPPAAFLLACRIETKQPTPRFPYGFYRVGTIAFLSGSLALTCMGLYLLYTGVRGLIQAKHPQLQPLWAHGSVALWHGWWIIAALLYSIAVPFVAGRSRQQTAIEIHDKGLYADATMGRINWLAGSAAVIGVLGIGVGLWWADFVATLTIGADILWCGYRHLYTAICDLIDEVPRRIGTSTIDPLGTNIRKFLQSQPWVADVRVRLREEGRLLTGIALICPIGNDDLVDRFEQARAAIEDMDWRLLDFQLVPLCDATFERLDGHQAPVGQ